MIARDTILSRGMKPSGNTIPCSKTLQAVLDFNTKLFHGKGVSAAIISKKKGFWSGTDGYSEPGKPVDPDMLFNIASIGKNFLAVLIVQLAEDGKLSLDDSIATWELGNQNIDESITIRQLLNHTSGIFDWVTHRRSPFFIPYCDIDYTKSWTCDEILNELSGKPYFPPGEGWHYSTTNYNLLKIIAEKVTGTPVSKEIYTRFLHPLSLGHVIYLDIDDQIPPGLEIVHSWFDVNGDGELEDISGNAQNWIASMSPHMMYASAMDLARWSQALYNGEVLSRIYLNQVLDFHRPTPGEPPITGYGLGTEEIAVKNIIRSYGHLGFHYGSMSAMLYFPKLGTSMVVLSNENNQPFQYGVTSSLLIVMLLRQARYFLIIAVLAILTFMLYKKRKRKKLYTIGQNQQQVAPSK
jgi:D-alanyl-D-alanine carboxypeptidase